jgi:dTDP-4-dehydrorhamnose 3,5-epimerase
MQNPTEFFGSVTDLKWLEDGRGRLMEILRNNPKPDGLGGVTGLEFGQAYVTTCRPGVVKAWHHHTRQMDRMVCLSGSLQVGLYSETLERVATVYSTDRNPRLITIIPGIWHGFSSVGGTEAIVLNIPDRAYNPEFPDEQRRPAHDPGIPYKWGIHDG